MSFPSESCLDSQNEDSSMRSPESGLCNVEPDSSNLNSVDIEKSYEDDNNKTNLEMPSSSNEVEQNLLQSEPSSSLEEKDNVEATSSCENEDIEDQEEDGIQNAKVSENQGESSSQQTQKRRLSVITISDTDSEDSSDVCLVDSYQATASEAKRMRRGYSSSESESESSEDEEELTSDPENPTVVVCEAPSILSKCCSILSQRASRDTPACLNPCFEDKSLIERITNHWKNEESFDANNVALYKDPFRICVLNQFLKDPDIIHNIIDDMTTLDWSRRKMDLYEFHRSSDLVNLSWQRCIKSFYDLLKDQVMSWVSEITNLKLTHVSASCALYGPGDHLLVHDDLMSDRKVAFIFYMTPWSISKADTKASEESNIGVNVGNDANVTDGKDDIQPQWLEDMGGALELLTVDDKGLPTKVARSIFPKNNSFAFFKVGSNTFHQVSEVLTYDFPRLTINGWFHGPPEEAEPPPKHVEIITPIPYKDLKETPHTEMCQSSLNQWITSNYLSPRTKYKIQQQIESTSEISLEDFFMNKLYDDILNDLTMAEANWEWTGPAHLQRYEVLNMEKAGHNVKELQKLFSSEQFLKLLSEFTDLRLTSYHSLQVQRWTAGSYTVIPPLSHSLVTELDVILYLGAPDKKFSGGSTVYLAPEEAESIPLITIEPLNNSLNIVYSDAGTTRFTKYINKLGFNKDEYFYIVTCSYRE